jgi:hypothetical protein
MDSEYINAIHPYPIIIIVIIFWLYFILFLMDLCVFSVKDSFSKKKIFPLVDILYTVVSNIIHSI